MRPLLITRLRTALAMAGCLVTAACSTDRIAAPTAASDQPGRALAPAAAISDILNAVEQTVTVGGRLSPLRHAVTATATIGSEGGRVSLPELGFELVVPRGAVSGATRFRVTALAGTTLSYEFEPHGAKFNIPLIFRQDGLLTRIGWGQQVGGAYFTDYTKVNQQTQKAQVAEQVPGRWNGFWIEFKINHFSGYLVSCA